jgi:hypothetical protein
MADTALVQSWFVRVDRQEVGAFDEVQLLAFIRGGLIEAQIRPGSADDEFPWLPLSSHPPFATALGNAPKRAPTTTKGRNSGPKPVLHWVNAALAIALVALAAYSMRNGARATQPSTQASATRAVDPPRPKRRLRSLPTTPYSGESRSWEGMATMLQLNLD